MIASKRLAAATAVLMCLCLAVCGFIVYAAGAFDTAKITEYQKRLFNGEIITIDIQIDPDSWQSLLDNATAKEWISGDLIINGERFSAVGIRTKGNSSLSMGMMGGSSGNERYSLQFKLNKYVKGQTYYGLDAFCVNNMIGDATYMKDYLAYEIMDYIGVATPLASYANVAVNGEHYGFCLALERYDEAFLDRVYSTSAGELYSVKISMGGRGDFEDRWQDVENSLPVRRRQEDGESAMPDFSQSGGFGGMGGGMGGGGSLVYTGDDPASYSAIFDNAVFGTTSDKEAQRVITAIKNLNEGTDLEKYLDVDGILRYFAAHTVVVNLDSYISNMQQNYYIYERGGKITVLPWDYNLAFGGYMSGDASGVVNFPIDTPVSGVSMEDRPLLNKLLEVDEYRERYHDYLRQIVEGYLESGLFESTVYDLDAKISAYVENDATAYFTYEQYQASLPALVNLMNLRAQSIKGQLGGTIPSTSTGQNADGSALIDASSVNLSALGSMTGGGMGQGGWGGAGERGQGGPQREGQEGGAQNGGFAMPEGMDMALMQQAMQIIADAGGELTEQAKAALSELGLTEEQILLFAGMWSGMPGGNRQSPPGAESLIMLGVPAVLLLAAIAFVAKPRKNVV